MSAEKLIRMANQIAAFFKTLPGEDAAARTACHLRDFWDPEMRAELRRIADADGTGIDEVVRRAARDI